jgi:hypothetical protein
LLLPALDAMTADHAIAKRKMAVTAGAPVNLPFEFQLSYS